MTLAEMLKLERPASDGTRATQCRQKQITKAVNALTNAAIESPEDLQRFTFDDLLRIKNCGKKTALLIWDWVESRGWSLQPSKVERSADFDRGYAEGWNAALRSMAAAAEARRKI